MRLIARIAVAGSVLALTACTSNPNPPDQAGSQVSNPAAQSASADNGCKDFPVPLYPSTTELSCSQSGDRYTASIETNDSIEQVTEFYQTQAQSSGWTKDPDPLISPEHTVVKITKGPGHAVISTFLGKDKKGCSFQINAFPKGNP